MELTKGNSLQDAMRIIQKAKAAARKQLATPDQLKVVETLGGFYYSPEKGETMDFVFLGWTGIKKDENPPHGLLAAVLMNSDGREVVMAQTQMISACKGLPVATEDENGELIGALLRVTCKGVTKTARGRMTNLEVERLDTK